MPKVDIAPVLEHYGARVPPARGGWQTITCPFHEDRTASARVNYETGGFRCFACDISGDGFTVVMEREGKDFPGAVEFITGIVGVEIEDVRESAIQARRRSGIFEEPRIDRRQRPLFSPGGRRRALSGG